MPDELIFVFIVVLLVAWATYRIRLGRAAQAVYQRLKAEGALLAFPAASASFREWRLGQPPPRRRGAVVALTPTGLVAYPRSLAMDEVYTVPYSALRWFGRPHKYHGGSNDIWLHFERDGSWERVDLRLPRAAMADLVRQLKEYAPPELVTAYRRRRPYVHFGPVIVRPAEDDIYGAWTLHDPVALYVMPLALVILQGERVLHVLPLDEVRQVTAMRRIDRPEADGLVTFTAGGEQWAFASEHYQALAQAVADAARRSLEAPLLQKQKGKDDYDEDDEEDDDDQADDEAGEADDQAGFADGGRRR